MKKYSRTLHSPISLGSTSDDRFMPNGYLDYFTKVDLVLTEKLDGQNNCFNKNGVFARSHTSPSIHPWDEPLRKRWELIKKDLGDYEIFGENVYATHGIRYDKLESFFYVFGVRVDDVWLSWKEVKEIAYLFDFPTVPECNIRKPLSDFNYIKDEDMMLDEWLVSNLGMTWEDYTNTSGKLGGFDIFTNEPCSEGFVIRNKDEFKTNNGNLPTKVNEFDNIFKLVRANHVKTNEHWTKNWKPAKLINYQRYSWWEYEYLNKKK